jgi:hypothetical protein
VLLMRWADRRSFPLRCHHAREVRARGAGPSEVGDRGKSLSHHPGRVLEGVSEESQPNGVARNALSGSSGRTRTYNPPVNSRMLYH